MQNKQTKLLAETKEYTSKTYGFNPLLPAEGKFLEIHVAILFIKKRYFETAYEN